MQQLKMLEPIFEKGCLPRPLTSFRKNKVFPSLGRPKYLIIFLSQKKYILRYLRQKIVALNKVYPRMKPTIVEKYKMVKRLGRGSYGEVVLAENPKNQLVALKMLIKEDMEENTRQNLEGEIRCMQEIDSPYVVKMYEREEDELYIYLVCEYCEGGDLFNYQAGKKGRRFNLDEAAMILSEVIRGLEDLHKKQYLHRDIKSQNILVKKGKNGQPTFKLADMGFSKEINSTHGTVLGTEKFMAPEIFDWDRLYGFEVDMWALGVVFFFMLNAEYPFSKNLLIFVGMNPHLLMERKYEELTKMAKDFSYQKAVSKTKAKDTSSCSKETEDLFKRMFEVNQKERIQFPEIRVHPVFKKYFKEGNASSIITYKNNLNYSSSMMKSFNKGKQNPEKPLNTKNILHPSAILKKVSRAKNSDFHVEKSILKGWRDQIGFLADSEIQISNYAQGILQIEEIISARYCLLKMYLILLKELKESRISLQNLTKYYPQIQWKKFLASSQYRNFENQLTADFEKNELNLSNIYTDCQKSLESISKFNSNLVTFLESHISEEKSGKDFTKVYRQILRKCFEKFQNLKTEKKANMYMAINLLICFIFDQLILTSQADLLKIFKPYVQERGGETNVVVLDLEDVRSWIQTANKQIIYTVFDNITNYFFRARK